MNLRDFSNQEEHEHVLVPPAMDVRDNLGNLAVQVLAAKHDIANMSSSEIVEKLLDIVCDLHSAYSSMLEHRGQF